ncbi:MAG: DNA-binding response regulator [Herbinix sp.]|jgi:DNA-binding response OmpR family regulator|nr:DNA-binding response regulator [Herbinix sp.]
METANILIVEDNEDINRILYRYLSKEGYQVTSAFSGTEAKLLLSMKAYDLVLLDLMLPGMSGEELIPIISKDSNTPILVISAKSTLEDRVNALKIGADDYITKPFEREEILARVEAILRRTMGNKQSSKQEKVLEFKKLILKIHSREVFVDNHLITLTAHEFDILHLLIQNPDRVYTKDLLYEEIWKAGYYGEDNTINVHISNIRKKIKEYDEDSYIKTVWGIGFKLET